MRFVDPDGMLVDEFNLNKKTGTITKVSDYGGSQVDYYNIGITNENSEFTSQDCITINRDENCHNVNSFRIEETSNSTTSTFNIPGTEVSGFFLEPAGPSTTVANQDRRIPEGSYDVKDYSSKKFPNTFQISNAEVSEDRKILIHPGNDGDDTSGCLLPGSSKSEGYVSSSKAKMGEIRNIFDSVGTENIRLNINNINSDDQK